MTDLQSLQNIKIEDNGYLYGALLPENVFAHTKKIRLFRGAISRFQIESGRESLRILDIGCGNGYAVTRFLGKVGCEVLGIDTHLPSINYAERHFKQNGLSFACIDADSFLLEDRLFDIVVLADILEHLDDPTRLLESVVKLLAPNGRILITIPNGYGPFELEVCLSKLPVVGFALLKLFDISTAILNKSILKGSWSRAVAWMPKNLPYNHDSRHMQFFKRLEVIQLASNVGLQLLDFRNLSFLSGPFSNYLFSPSQTFCQWNARIADRLPAWLCSAWFFEFSKTPGGN